jgi:hypothetical protein
MEKHDFTKHLFRASGFGHLMTGGSKEITETQLARIDELEAKEIEVKGLGKGDTDMLAKYKAMDEPNEKQAAKIIELEAKKIKPTGLTEIQETELYSNIDLRDNPMNYVALSKGAKTMLRKMRREIKFKRRREINSKYLTKGIELEETAIDWLSQHHDIIFTNNKERRENEYFTGECDIEEGYDTKVAWSLDTLPDPEENLKTIYEYQNRVYMILWDKEEWTTSSVALSMLEDELKRTLYGELWKWGGEEIPEWRKIEIIKFYCYEQDYFHEMLTANDCFPDIKEYKRILEANEDMPVDLEKACEMYLSFIEIPGDERIVEKTVIRDKKIEGKMEKIAILAREYMQSIEDEKYLKS